MELHEIECARFKRKRSAAARVCLNARKGAAAARAHTHARACAAGRVLLVKEPTRMLLRPYTVFRDESLYPTAVQLDTRAPQPNCNNITYVLVECIYMSMRAGSS
jgi:hypothetical protein